jgi:hypothetical protein
MLDHLMVPLFLGKMELFEKVMLRFHMGIELGWSNSGKVCHL